MRTVIAPVIVGLGLSVAIGAARVSAQSTLEDKVKAAIVSKFPQFVEWPAGALNGHSTIDLCIVSADPIQADFEELVTGETVGGRQLSVRRVQRDQEVDGCHVLFVRAAAVPSNRSLLQRASSLPVLTVSDDQSFLDEGGIVRLRQVDGRLRFDVNAAAAQKVGLRISSQMLQLALSVRGGPA
jgi:hypothetical protein